MQSLFQDLEGLDVLRRRSQTVSVARFTRVDTTPGRHPKDWLVEKFNLDLSLVARLGGHSQPRTHRGKERFPGMTITYALIQMLEKAQGFFRDAFGGWMRECDGARGGLRQGVLMISFGIELLELQSRTLATEWWRSGLETCVWLCTMLGEWR